MTRKTNHDALIGPLLLLLLIVALHRLPGRPDGYESVEPGPHEKCFIQVSGGVAGPGVFSFSRPPAPDRLIRLAGGPAGGAVEKARRGRTPLRSGSRIDVITEYGESVFTVTEMSAFYKITLGVPVALNRETRDGLTAIPGIGAKTAETILKKRSSAGTYERLDQLLGVEGIGRARLERIRPYVTLGPGGSQPPAGRERSRGVPVDME